MRYCAHKHLLAYIWRFNSRTDLEKEVKVTKSNQPFVMSQYYIILKITSRSPKPKQHFVTSQRYIQAN